MADADFKLPGSSFDELIKIVQAYALINKPASLDDVSRRIGMNPTMVSANNGFLISIGILLGGKSKTITPLGKQLGDAISHGIEEEAKRLWRQFVDDSEFLKNVVSAVRIRRGMEEGALKAHIAYSAGVSKSASVTTGAGAVIELLRQAGAIVDEDGKYVVGSLTESITPEASATTQPATSPVVHISPALHPSRSLNGLSISIEVKVNCTPAELDGLGTKLRAIVDEFNAALAADE
jgi:hypothetical protein